MSVRLSQTPKRKRTVKKYSQATTAIPPQGEVAPGSGIQAITQYLPKLTNPDEVARQRGLSYYSVVMMQDAHIAAEMTKRVLSVVNKPRGIVPGNVSPLLPPEVLLERINRLRTGPDDQLDQDERIAKFINWNFEEYLDRGWNAVTRQLIQGALVSGVSVQEVIWNPRCSSGRYKGATVIEDLKDRDPEMFLLDNYGHVYLKKHIWDTAGELQHPQKFIVFAWLPEYENPYGTPILRSLRWYDWFKRQGMTYWMIFLEKFSQPTVVGTYPSGATKEQKDMLQSAIESVQIETGIRIPDTMKIYFLEASRSGEAGYDLLKDACNREISKVICGQTLTTETSQKDGGTYALGYIHNLIRADINAFDCQEVDRMISNTIIPWLVDYNFMVDYYPRHHTFTTIEMEQIGNTWQPKTQKAIPAAEPQPQLGRPADGFESAPQLFDRSANLSLQTYAQKQKKPYNWQRPGLAYLRYCTCRDHRVRPAHRVLEGLTLTPKEFVEYGLFPPLDWGCRCWVEDVTQERAEQEGIVPTIELPSIEHGKDFTGKPDRW